MTEPIFGIAVVLAIVQFIVGGVLMADSIEDYKSSTGAWKEKERKNIKFGLITILWSPFAIIIIPAFLIWQFGKFMVNGYKIINRMDE